MNRKYSFWIGCVGLLLLLVLASSSAEAQCAMCRAQVESSSGSGDSIANGLNKGILYLMAIPYIIAGAVGFFWYRYSKSQK